MEDILIKSKSLHLPGKKKLIDTSINWEVVVIDAGESPIERPKKTMEVLFRKKEKAYNKNANSSRQENKENNLHGLRTRKMHDFRLFKESKQPFIHPLKPLRIAAIRVFKNCIVAGKTYKKEQKRGPCLNSRNDIITQ